MVAELHRAKAPKTDRLVLITGTTNGLQTPMPMGLPIPTGRLAYLLPDPQPPRHPVEQAEPCLVSAGVDPWELVLELPDNLLVLSLVAGEVEGDGVVVPTGGEQ